MDRKEFLKWCGGSCLAVMAATPLFEQCASVAYVQGTVVDNQLTLSKDVFVVVKNDKTSLRRYVIVRVDQLAFPLVIYRFSDSSFKALLMACPHQQAELTVHGDMLTCPAHGSEFDNQGLVLQGPAEDPLTSFRITVDSKNVYVHI